MKIGRGNRSTRRKPTPAPLCPPQIPHDQTRDRTRAAVVEIRELVNFCGILTHGPEPFLRSPQLCSYSRTSQLFMEPECALSCSQELSTDPCPEPDQSNPIQSNPHHPISLRSILISSTHLRIDLPSGLFSSGFLTIFLFSPIRATCPVHLILLDLITLIILGEDYKL
jgi:hypothetical protein